MFMEPSFYAAMAWWEFPVWAAAPFAGYLKVKRSSA